MFDLWNVFDFRKIFAVLKDFLISKNYCNNKYRLVHCDWQKVSIYIWHLHHPRIDIEAEHSHYGSSRSVAMILLPHQRIVNHLLTQMFLKSIMNERGCLNGSSRSVL